MKNKYQELLLKFCGNDEYRPKLAHPFFDGVDVCATDCYWLMRVKPEAYGLELPNPGPKRIEAKPLKKPLVLSVENLVSAFLKCDLVDEKVIVSPEVKCEECDGTGEVEWEYCGNEKKNYYEYFDCPICEGSGVLREAVTRNTGRKIPEKLNNSISINGVAFDAYRLFYIVEACNELGVETVFITSLGKPGSCDPAVFKLNEHCEVVLMPIGSKYESVHSFNIK